LGQFREKSAIVSDVRRIAGPLDILTPWSSSLHYKENESLVGALTDFVLVPT